MAKKNEIEKIDDDQRESSSQIWNLEIMTKSVFIRSWGPRIWGQ